MSRNQRIGLIVGAVVFAVVAFVIASPGDDDDGGDQAAGTTQTTTEPRSETSDQGTPTETETEPAEPERPAATRIQIRGGEVAAGPADITVTKGDRVVIVVSSEAPDDIHLHGYDIEKTVEPGKVARFNFTADVEGIFEIESHVAEDAGKDPLVGKLTVEPS